MRQFRVLAPIQLSNKRIAEFGAIVGEKQLHDNADELLKRGFVEVFEVDKKAVSIEVDADKDLGKDDTKTQPAPKAKKAKNSPSSPKK